MDDFKFDTVDKLQTNLFSVSDYYEAGADIHLTHNGFSGVTGINPKTNQSFTIPCVYSPEHKGWLVHFVVANSMKEARERGKHIEKSIRNGSQRLNDSVRKSRCESTCTMRPVGVSQYFAMEFARMRFPSCCMIPMGNSDCMLVHWATVRSGR